MKKINKYNTCRSRKAACTAICIFAAVSTVGCSRKPLIPTPPIPKGEAMIHVEFKGVPTNKFNGLAEFVKKLSENDSAFVEGSTSEREAGDSNTYHGFWNDGIVDQAYKPNHPTPGPEVEKYMKTRLLSYLHDNGIDASKVKLELVYGL